MRAGRFRKRRGESQSFWFRDADQESKTRMRNNALRTGPRQAVDMMAFLLKQTKEALLEVAIDLGVEVYSTLTKSEIKNRICQSEDYNEESVKSLLEGILAEKRETKESERETREYEERKLIREFELERMKLSNSTDTISVSSTDLEGQGVNRRVNLRDLVPKFDAKNADINLYFEIFERQVKKEKVAEDRWVSQLIPLLPIEIAEIVAKEPLEKSDDYPYIKNLLLARFQLTPIALRDRFESHQRRPGAMWADLVFELRSYLDNWLAGMKVDSWDGFKEAKSLAEKLDHFEAIRRVHKKPGPTKIWERRTFDKQPLESKNKSAHFSGKGKHIGPLNRDPYKHEVSHGSSQIRRECPRAGESQFEKRKPIICYYCNETGHIKPVCPRLRKNNFETVANLTLNTGNHDPFKKFKMNMEINGIDRICLRDSGSSIDVCSRSWINENDLLDEYVWLKSPLDEICHCLPLAKIKIKTKKGEFYTKAAIKQDSSDNDLYLLGNRTAELLESNEQGVQLVNAVVTKRGRAPQFEKHCTSELTTTFFNKFGIKVTRSSVSHPQSNAVERVHRTIKRVIKVLCVESGEDWEGVLPLALFSLRTVAHESTGFSPTELVMGKNLRTPQTLVYEEWMEEGNTSQSVVEYILQLNNRLKRCQDIAITRMKECQLKRKTWYDRDAVERKFVEGDLVMVLATSKQNKLEVNWIGPGKVLSRISDTNYVIDLPGRRDRARARSIIYHVNLLKPYHRRSELVSLVVEEVSGDIEGDAEIPYPDKQCTKFDYHEILRESQLQLKLSPSQIDELKQVITKK
ncbi:retrovirus-related Pol polyprotein from transposon 412 [Trichonephila clavipes]|nr:retrovirus-related Pol polyprotein from transposon 412 [Trichonephila clavipes]